MVTSTGPLATIQRWHAAVNAVDADALAELATEDITVVGPRGVGHGRPVLLDWLRRAGLSYRPRRWFFDGRANAVVEELATWRDVATGEVLTADALVASRFVLTGGRISCYARHDALDEALGEAGLDGSARVEPPA
ncbi:nuclear transport factor 2 family protein [Dactylosporangium sp. AC04546]|uniref:nuclear transport factor 2 family protein n=1 Tax=Dactylosporangium sp. AC04546 TaxID=2862460 RepID=UPI001EE0C0EF|nr:nuclear transport factor 2 family protein [Dactylosporangium sp. AC04546]WVK79042.1 nuclear transport factor 2 family protein [Dactylosporangium sp. AC04546]